MSKSLATEPRFDKFIFDLRSLLDSYLDEQDLTKLSMRQALDEEDHQEFEELQDSLEFFSQSNFYDNTHLYPSEDERL